MSVIKRQQHISIMTNLSGFNPVFPPQIALINIRDKVLGECISVGQTLNNSIHKTGISLIFESQRPWGEAWWESYKF